ncbi:MAG: bacteriorhodopsin [Leptolyngbyaceae cyanobacterium SM2_3_12]|nr:bacteriorhodopsin [Leptolyngbyaceae cyanobacterium SM2_3_12]
MDWQGLFHRVYVVAMAIGAVYFMLLSRNPRGIPKYEYYVAAFIPIWSGLAYLSMTLPQGELAQGKIAVAGQITHYARYLDWIVTTPLLLVALAWTAMYYVSKDWTLIGSLIGTQGIVVLSGLIADLSAVGWVRLLWYSIGVVAFLILLGLVWGPLRNKSRGQEPALAKFFDRLTTYFTVLWICYPIVWILGPSGFGAIGQTFETFLFCLIPFFSKVGFSFIDLHGLRSLQNSGAERGADRAIGHAFHPRRSRSSYFRT